MATIAACALDSEVEAIHMLNTCQPGALDNHVERSCLTPVDCLPIFRQLYEGEIHFYFI